MLCFFVEEATGANATIHNLESEETMQVNPSVSCSNTVSMTSIENDQYRCGEVFMQISTTEEVANQVIQKPTTDQEPSRDLVPLNTENWTDVDQKLFEAEWLVAKTKPENERTFSWRLLVGLGLGDNQDEEEQPAHEAVTRDMLHDALLKTQSFDFGSERSFIKNSAVLDLQEEEGRFSVVTTNTDFDETISAHSILNIKADVYCLQSVREQSWNGFKDDMEK